MVGEIDELWPLLRRRDAQHLHWRWMKLLKKKRNSSLIPERFALICSKTKLIEAIWCSSADRLKHYGGKKCYLLSNIEVFPKSIAKSVGHLTMAIVASRAIEQGAEAIVLQSLSQSCKFYERIGGRQTKLRELHNAKNLITYIFDGDALARLKEMSDGLGAEEEGQGEVLQDGR